jgi:hypothetical protein
MSFCLINTVRRGLALIASNAPLPGQTSVSLPMLFPCYKLGSHGLMRQCHSVLNWWLHRYFAYENGDRCYVPSAPVRVLDDGQSKKTLLTTLPLVAFGGLLNRTTATWRSHAPPRYRVTLAVGFRWHQGTLRCEPLDPTQSLRRTNYTRGGGMGSPNKAFLIGHRQGADNAALKF